MRDLRRRRRARAWRRTGARDLAAHEATHALAHKRGVKDTSRQGRYHNRRFKTLAEELGLHVDHDPRPGWSPTALPDATAARYAAVIAALERAITAHRHGERTMPGTARGGRNLTACSCECGRRIRIAPTVLDLGPVICGVCSAPFVPAGG